METTSGRKRKREREREKEAAVGLVNDY